jgi:hypothetical protein
MGRGCSDSPKIAGFLSGDIYHQRVGGCAMVLEDALAYALVVGIVLTIVLTSISNYRRRRADRDFAAYEASHLEGSHLEE